MVLSQRLLAAASLAPQCECAADVGCDHGYIPIYLTQNDICKRAIAMDLREGPLARCRENVVAAKLEDRIDIRLSDGLEKLNPGEAQVISILGMGGIVMQSIIENRMDVAKTATLILGPQSQVGDFRRFLYKSGFVITDEMFLIEDDKNYNLMKAEYCETGIENGGSSSVEAEERSKVDRMPNELTEIQYEYGPVLLKKRDDVFMGYLKNRYEKINTIIQGIQGESDNKSKLKQELINLEKAINDTF